MQAGAPIRHRSSISRIWALTRSNTWCSSVSLTIHSFNDDEINESEDEVANIAASRRARTEALQMVLYDNTSTDALTLQASKLKQRIHDFFARLCRLSSIRGRGCKSPAQVAATVRRAWRGDATVTRRRPPRVSRPPERGIGVSEWFPPAHPARRQHRHRPFLPWSQ